MPDRANRCTRRSILAGTVAFCAAVTQRGLAGQAQDDAPAAIASPSAGMGSIKPTGVGDVPSTGASRPGPVNFESVGNIDERVAPVGLAVEAAGIDADIEALRVVNGAMQDPSGPWIVAWYENLGTLGRAGNVVMAGHIDYWNVGPAVFYNLSTLEPGDEIVVAGNNGESYPFAVESVRQYDSASMPLDEVVGPTESQSVTLITCGGAFDYVNGLYLQRTVVRANQVSAGAATTA